MADELKDAPWHDDLEQFVGELIDAKKNLSSGFWCMDSDVKYVNIRVDTRDMSYLVSADGRGDASNMKNTFRISPDSVRTAINEWRDKFHSK